MIADWLIKVADARSVAELAAVRDGMNAHVESFTPDEKAKLRTAVADKFSVFANDDTGRPDKPQNVTCPICGGSMKSRMSKRGAFWGCARYPDCHGTRNVEGQSRTDREARQFEEDSMAPERYRPWSRAGMRERLGVSGDRDE